MTKEMLSNYLKPWHLKNEMNIKALDKQKVWDIVKDDNKTSLTIQVS